MGRHRLRFGGAYFGGGRILRRAAVQAPALSRAYRGQRLRAGARRAPLRRCRRAAAIEGGQLRQLVHPGAVDEPRLGGELRYGQIHPAAGARRHAAKPKLKRGAGGRAGAAVPSQLYPRRGLPPSGAAGHERGAHPVFVYEFGRGRRPAGKCLRTAGLGGGHVQKVRPVRGVRPARGARLAEHGSPFGRRRPLRPVRQCRKRG